MSCQVTLPSITCSHFIQAHCCCIATLLLARSSSTEVCTYSCTSICLCFMLATSYLVDIEILSPALLCVSLPKRAFYLSQASTCWTALVALHFLHVFMVIPALNTLVSLDPVYCRCSLPHVTKCHSEFLPDRAEREPELIAVPIQPDVAQAVWQAQPPVEIAAHLALKA